MGVAIRGECGVAVAIWGAQRRGVVGEVPRRQADAVRRASGEVSSAASAEGVLLDEYEEGRVHCRLGTRSNCERFAERREQPRWKARRIQQSLLQVCVQPGECLGVCAAQRGEGGGGGLGGLAGPEDPFEDICKRLLPYGASVGCGSCRMGQVPLAGHAGRGWAARRWDAARMRRASARWGEVGGSRPRVSMGLRDSGRDSVEVQEEIQGRWVRGEAQRTPWRSEGYLANMHRASSVPHARTGAEVS